MSLAAVGTAVTTTTTPPPPRGITIVSWNIGQRGLRRTVSEVFAGSLPAMLTKLGSPDILCLQETKITRIELCRWADDLVKLPGYVPYVSFHRKGIAYCGVATYCALSCLPVAAGTYNNKRMRTFLSSPLCKPTPCSVFCSTVFFPHRTVVCRSAMSSPTRGLYSCLLSLYNCRL